MQLVRLVYVSRMNEACDTEALQRILEVSNRKNREKEITGVLCYDPAFFLQCIEGRRTPINALFADIQNDTRHSDVMLLEYSDIESRLFADWSMAFVRARDLDGTLLQKYTGGVKLDPYKLTARQAREFLAELAGKGGAHLASQARD